ncbi:MAG: FAD-binding oxidoreductase [Methanomassiliicoccales archaeon]
MDSERSAKSEAVLRYVKKLEDALGKDNVKTSEFERLLYSHDLAPLPKEAQLAFKNIPDVVVRPRSTEDVQKIVRIAAEEGVPVTPRGSSTWGLGGSVSAFGGILIDMSGGMNKILKIDKENLCVTAEAGATWKQVYDACMSKGLLLGSYPSSFPSATLAGWISTGGIGIGNYKYGSAGNNIRNMEVVMPDGNIINTGFDELCDNSSGYNLNWLIVGAEGTLGVVTKVTFKLYPAPELMKPVSYAMDDLISIGPALMEVCRSRIEPLHISFGDRKHYELLRKAGKHAPEVGSMLSFTLEGDSEVVKHEEQVLDRIMEAHGAKKMPDEVAIHEWEERCYEYRSREIGVGEIPGEVVVPLREFSSMAKATYDLMEAMKMEGAVIGIMADRNTAMFMPYYLFDSESLVKTMTSLAFNKKYSDLAFQRGGRPLGFGMFFASNLSIIRGNSVKYMKAIKDALDPKGIMNPGKLFETVTRQGIHVHPTLFELGMDALAIAKKALPKDQEINAKAKQYEIERLEKEKKGSH